MNSWWNLLTYNIIKKKLKVTKKMQPLDFLLGSKN